MDYDRIELVDWIRGIYQNLDDADKQDALRFFPELRESEDERIRSCICLALTDVNEQRFKDFGITLKDCLSWLEKQKKQKPVEEIKDQRQIYFMIEDGRRCGVIEGRKQVIDNPEEYGLQKPAWSEEDVLTKMKYAGTSTKLD